MNVCEFCCGDAFFNNQDKETASHSTTHVPTRTLSLPQSHVRRFNSLVPARKAVALPRSRKRATQVFPNDRCERRDRKITNIVGDAPATAAPLRPRPLPVSHSATSSTRRTIPPASATNLPGCCPKSAAAAIGRMRRKPPSRRTNWAATNIRESAMEATLAPGNYPTVLHGENNSTGVGLVEA